MKTINKNITSINRTVCNNRNIKYIVIHYTANNGDTAWGNTHYFKLLYRDASAHYFVDENEIWQCVEDKDKAWHCGGGRQTNQGGSLLNICTNTNSIGVEMCSRINSKGEYYFLDETVQNTVELVKYLMEKYNIPASNVVRHFDVNGKICPKPYINETAWANFKNKLVAPTYITSANDITWELNHSHFPITDTDGFVRALEQAKQSNSPLYWGYYKLANNIKN